MKQVPFAASTCWPLTVLPSSKQNFVRSSPSTLKMRSIRNGRQWLALADLATDLIEALQTTLAFTPADEVQRMAQHEIITALETAMEARRQRSILSRSSVRTVKWAGLLLQAFLTLIAIAMVHSDNRLACRIALALFAIGIALSVLLIAAYTRPFTGELIVGPELLKLVEPTSAS
jgi:hypothetical protein